MFKKLAIAAVAVLLVGGLLFGRNLVPYATTAYDRVKASVNEHVPIDHQIDAAESQLKGIDKEIKTMRYEIAKETVAVRQLNEDVIAKQDSLDSQWAKIMTLKGHLESGDSHYVTSGRAYNNRWVEKDLTNRFTNYKTSKATFEKMQQIADLRQQGLNAAEEKLKETIAQKQELEVKIENLRAQLKMVEVAQTANKIKIDNSKLSRTQQMLNDIEARIEVESEMMNLIPDAPGIIPVGEETETGNGNILEDIDAYQKKKVSDKEFASAK